MPRLPLLLAAFLALGLPVRAQVEASLVAADAGVQPGGVLTVALHLAHEPHWHTYWVNPGEGLATTIRWELPPGWTADEIQWPTPKVFYDERHVPTGNGYEGDLLLPVAVHAPATARPGETVVLRAGVDWLVCEHVCKPGHADLSLRVPVTPGPRQPDPSWSAPVENALRRVPADDPSWSLSASRDASGIRLYARRSGPGGRASIDPASIHFFSADGAVAYDQPQSVAVDPDGFNVTLRASADGPKDVTRLVGALAADGGWNADGSVPALRVDAGFGAAPAAASGLGATLLLALVGGAILNLMPCVFPVLGIKILGFVNQSGADRRKVTLHGLSFTSGVLLSFWALAALLAVLRAGGSSLGWGFQLQSPGFVFGLAAVMLAFGLNMSGVFEFGLTATGIGSGLQSKSGLLGSFLTGALATVAATPCSAPFLAPALGGALALPVAQSFAIFTAIGLGLSAPYLLLSAFPSAVRLLPRPGAWMETFKQAMAFPLYATVAYLVWVLAGQLPEAGLLNALLGLVLVALGVWAYGRWSAPGASPARARFGIAAGAVFLALGAWAGLPKAPGALDITWQPWSAEAVANLRADNRIVYVDFTARWCATCQANKRIVFHSADVLRVFHERNVATLRGDWTNRDPLITAELARYGRAAVPFNLVWLPGKPDPVLLPEVLTPSLVLEAVGR